MPPATPSPRALGATPSTPGLQRYVPSQTTLLPRSTKTHKLQPSDPHVLRQLQVFSTSRAVSAGAFVYRTIYHSKDRAPVLPGSSLFFQFVTDGLLRAAHLAPFPPSDPWSVLGDSVQCSDFQTHVHCIITELTIQLP